MARDGFQVQHAAQVRHVERDGQALTVLAPTRLSRAGATRSTGRIVTVTLSAPLADVVRVRIEHHARRPPAGADIRPARRAGTAGADRDRRRARVPHQRRVDRPGGPSRAVAAGLPGGGPGADLQRAEDRSGLATGARTARTTCCQQLALGVGEQVYGLGERFGAAGQERPTGRHLERGRRHQQRAGLQERALLLDHQRLRHLRQPPRAGLLRDRLRGGVPDASSRCPGEHLEYLVIHGPTPKEILARYTELTGRPPAGARLVVRPLAVHLVHHRLRRGDRQQLHRRHGRARDPAQRLSFRLLLDARVPLVRLRVGPADLPGAGGDAGPAEGHGAADLRLDQPVHRAARRRCSRRAGRRGTWSPGRTAASGSGTAGRPAWRWSTSPIRRRRNGSRANWSGCSTRALTRSRPTSASASRPTWPGSTAPTRSGCTTTTRTCTTGRSSTCCERRRGTGEAVLFARSATAGGQQFPVHWGGDCDSTFASMAETLRGGLSLAASGFGYWSHDIGGFEGTPDAGGVQALAGLRAAVQPQPAARIRTPTGCRGRSTTRRSRSPGGSPG